jgi:FtsP/CotA-like multicopper oxidase with cupredoxin domain
MQLSHRLKIFSLSLAASLTIVGCGGGGSDPIAVDNTLDTLEGSVVKGPIENASILLKDPSGNTIASTTSSSGTFRFKGLDLQSDYYIIESHGGTYEDEATKQRVSLTNTQGLKTLLTRTQMKQMIQSGQFAALTPETTLYTELVQSLVSDQGFSLETALTKAEQLIYNELIKDSSPLPGLPGDRFVREGNLATAIPKNQIEAFARNRAISFSYMVRDMGLSPDKVFSLLDKLAANLKDGILDPEDLDNDGTLEDAGEEYALARTRLFQDTTTRLRNGELNDREAAELRAMGFDTENFRNDLQVQRTALSEEVANFLLSDTLPTLHILPSILDEDGNLTDDKATFSFTAMEDVNVTIETPEGSWITPMWRYNNSPLPLVLRAQRGQVMTLNLENNLQADTNIHWHGFKIPADMDGGPDTPVAPGTSKTYSFTMDQPAAPLWFHPHPDMQTGKQVYMGLAGVYLLEDTVSQTLEANNQLPTGEKDVVLLVQDRRFSAEENGIRELLYMNRPMDSDGMIGDTVLVNGSVVPKHEVSTTQYRYRLYNVSNARSYDFALSDGSTFKIVATDGGLLPSPVETDHVLLGAAERVEIIIDFSKYSVGDRVMLISRPFNGDMMGMMSMMVNMNGMGNAQMQTDTETNSMSSKDRNGAGLSIMRFDIILDETDTVQLYESLPSDAEIMTRLTQEDVTNTTERQFIMSMGGGMGSMQSDGSMPAMGFVINGKTFDPNRVDEFIEAGATEIWSIKNMSPMAHPFHAHAIQYQILDRNGIAATGADLGWKDTFLVQPGETVRIIGRFEPVNTGDYMYHCHILEHEDAGMMGYFRVGDTGVLGDQ